MEILVILAYEKFVLFFKREGGGVEKIQPYELNLKYVNCDSQYFSPDKSVIQKLLHFPNNYAEILQHTISNSSNTCIQSTNFCAMDSVRHLNKVF